VCAGIGSKEIGKMVGLDIPLWGFKGHSLDVWHKDKSKMFKHANLLLPEQVAIVPMGIEKPYTRFTGFADVDLNNKSVIKSRKESLIKIAKEYMGDEYDDANADHWVGLRPVTPDDTPFICNSSKYKNLWLNTGHGSRGMSSSMGSSKMLSLLITGQEVPKSFDQKAFDIRRFY